MGRWWKSDPEWLRELRTPLATMSRPPLDVAVGASPALRRKVDSHSRHAAVEASLIDSSLQLLETACRAARYIAVRVLHRSRHRGAGRAPG